MPQPALFKSTICGGTTLYATSARKKDFVGELRYIPHVRDFVALDAVKPIRQGELGHNNEGDLRARQATGDNGP